jgi:hypothetical protein
MMNDGVREWWADNDHHDLGEKIELEGTKGFHEVVRVNGDDRIRTYEINI